MLAGMLDEMKWDKLTDCMLGIQMDSMLDTELVIWMDILWDSC